MSAKVSDIHGAIGCSACHDAVDGRSKPMCGDRPYTKQELYVFHMDGVIRTQQYWQEIGLLPKP